MQAVDTECVMLCGAVLTAAYMERDRRDCAGRLASDLE
jgi:hypothetical protein